MKKGKVYIVGAGPGDPGLITVKGLNCLKKAEAVIYDRLIDDSLLDMVLPDAEKIYVGKGRGCHAKEQKDINQLLADKANEGKTVVRLKGGDPFVLGRGGEEADTLAENHIPFEIVPGISSALAVPAYAGIPVTDRRLASSFTVITGHEDPSKDKSSIKWDKISVGSDTLIFLMGMVNLSHIVDQLIKNGRLPSTPVAIIKQGTTPMQRSVEGTLENIVSRAEQQGFAAPAVIIVGEVVSLREQLRWFDTRPLFGKRILVTRTRSQASKLSRLLLEYGAQPVEMPVIEISPPSNWEELDQAILTPKGYDWVIFTSVNAVEVFFKRLNALGLDTRWFAGMRIGVIGSATAEAVGGQGIHPDYIPDKYTSHGFLSGISEQDISKSRVLLPRADIAGNELTDGLIEFGAEVHQVIAYKTVIPADTALKGRKMLLDGEIDVITFTSASTVNNLFKLLGKEREAVKRARLACIGPVTAAALNEQGLKADIVAEEHTITGLAEAMEQYYQGGG